MVGYGPIDCLIIFGSVALFGLIGLWLIDKGVV